MKRAKRTIFILGLALAGCHSAIAPPPATPQAVSVHLLATTATAPLIQELATGYESQGVLLAVHSVTASWESIYPRLLAADAPFVLTTYLPAEAALWAAPIGYDGIAIIVSADSSIEALTIEQVRHIFQGRIASWSELGGPEMPIAVICQEPGTDTSFVFQSQVMQGQRVTQTARLALTSARMIEQVAETPGAIGYVSMAYLDSRVRAVPLAAAPDAAPIALSADTVSSGAYPLRSPIVVAGPTAPDDDSIYRNWFAWMQSDAGQAIVGRLYGRLES